MKIQKKKNRGGGVRGDVGWGGGSWVGGLGGQGRCNREVKFL